MDIRNRQGEVITTVLLIIALLGGAAWVLKPKFLSGESKRAEKSTKTTEELKKAYEQNYREEMDEKMRKKADEAIQSLEGGRR